MTEPRSERIRSRDGHASEFFQYVGPYRLEKTLGKGQTGEWQAAGEDRAVTGAAADRQSELVYRREGPTFQSCPVQRHSTWQSFGVAHTR